MNQLKVIILSALISLPTQSQTKKLRNHGTIDCRQHRIYCKITKLKPSIDSKLAMELSNLIYKYSKVYKIDPFVTVAIVMQESGFARKDRKTWGLVDINGIETPTIVVTDVTLYQFHIKTINHYGLDLNKLRTNLEYATDSHFKILKDKINLCKKRGVSSSVAWSCYHSTTDKLRKRYIEDVSRYL